MPVSDGFRDFVLEQLERQVPQLRFKRMFGGGGLYAGETAVIERLTGSVVPSAIVRTESGNTRQVRTIDLEPIDPDLDLRSLERSAPFIENDSDHGCGGLEIETELATGLPLDRVDRDVPRRARLRIGAVRISEGFRRLDRHGLAAGFGLAALWLLTHPPA